jgi:hypothetical protein
VVCASMKGQFGPLGGEKLTMSGATRDDRLPVSVVAPVATDPVSAPAGSVAYRNVVPCRVRVVACTPPNSTTGE